MDAWLCELGCHGHVEAGEGWDDSRQARPGPGTAPQLPAGRAADGVAR